MSSIVTHKDDLPHEPTCCTMANKSPLWRHSIADEIDALMNNNNWTLVPPAPDMNLVGCKWVYRLKINTNGSIDRYKAWLVAKGFNQIEGFEYAETFSLVVKPTTIGVVLTLALMHRWPVKQLDVNNAFLQGHLTDNLYMRQPQGFIDPLRPIHV